MRDVKGLFGSLLCLVLATSQAFALKGGPNYGSGGPNIIGSYAGVLQGLFDPTNPASSNSIGIFTLGVPESGTASGSFIMFARGRTFRGTIDAAADPRKASLKGIVSARYDYNLQRTELDENGNPRVVSIPVTASVNGPIEAKAAVSQTRTFATSSTLLRGEATLFISGGYVNNSGDPIINEIVLLSVNGYKQSNTPPASGGTTAPSG